MCFFNFHNFDFTAPLKGVYMDIVDGGPYQMTSRFIQQQTVIDCEEVELVNK